MYTCATRRGSLLSAPHFVLFFLIARIQLVGLRCEVTDSQARKTVLPVSHSTIGFGVIQDPKAVGWRRYNQHCCL